MRTRPELPRFGRSTPPPARATPPTGAGKIEADSRFAVSLPSHRHFTSAFFASPRTSAFGWVADAQVRPGLQAFSLPSRSPRQVTTSSSSRVRPAMELPARFESSHPTTTIWRTVP